jgi:hypothetical protein
MWGHRIAVAAIGCFVVGAALAKEAESLYVVPNTGEEVVLYSRKIVVGDDSWPATTCDVKSGYLCFESDAFAFAVPLDIKHKTAWEFHGITYRVAQRWRVQKEDVWLVEGRSLNGGTPAVTFVFSALHGLRYLKRESVPSSSLSLVGVDSTGFGSLQVR